jgi:hypothetical protein
MPIVGCIRGFIGLVERRRGGEGWTNKTRKGNEQIGLAKRQYGRRRRNAAENGEQYWPGLGSPADYYIWP